MIISIPKILRERLGEDETETLVAMLNDYGKEIEDSVLKNAVKSFELVVAREISGLREEMNHGDSSLREEMKFGDAALREAMQEGDAALREAMLEGDAALRSELHKEIGILRSEIHKTSSSQMKWMFLFWVGQIGVITSLFFAFRS